MYMISFFGCYVLSLLDRLIFMLKYIFFSQYVIVFTFCSLKVRVDSGIQQGSDISIYYDPMISKVS